MPRSLPLALACLIASSTVLRAADKQPTEGGASQQKTTFVDDVLPIFRQRCGSCHNANDRKGSLIVDDYAALMEGGSSGAVIEAGDLSNSYLWSLVTHESSPEMPPNAEKLPAAELAVIEQWIEFGALENAGSVSNVKAKPTLAKIDVTGSRPEDVAMPVSFLGDPAHQPPRRNAVTALASSPWAPLAAVSGFQQVSLYNTRTLDLVGVLPYPEGQPQVLKFSRNGDLLLVGGGRGGAFGNVVVFDVRTGVRKVEVGAEYDEILAADISPDQTQIALGGPKRMLRVYSTATGELLYEVKKHTDWITAIEFSPDGVLLTSADRSSGLIVWEAYTGRLFYDLPGHKGAVTDVSWRPDSNVVASASEDGTIKLWEMQNGRQIKSWNAHGGGVAAMEYTRDGNLVSTGRDRVARFWKGDGAKIRDFPATADLGMEVAFDNESRRVLAGDWTGIVSVWSGEDGSVIGQIDTNPPTLELQLAALTSQLAPAQTDLAQKQQVLAQLSQQLALRTAAAQEAKATWDAEQARLKQSQQEKAAAAVALDQTRSAVEAVQKRADTTSEKMSQIQAEIAQIESRHTQAAQAVKVLEAKMQLLRRREQATQEGARKAETLAAAAADAAHVSEVETSAAAADAELRQSIDARNAIAIIAKSALQDALDLAGQARTAREKLEQELSGPQAALARVTNELATARTQLSDMQATLSATNQTHQKAKSDMEQAKAELAQFAEAEATALAAAKVAQAAYEQAAEVARPSEAEAQAMQAAQAAVASAEATVVDLQERIAWMQTSPQG